MNKQPELISIGIVDERGEHAFYAEMEHNKSKSSHFVEEVVYLLLQSLVRKCARICLRGNSESGMRKIASSAAADYDGDERLLRSGQIALNYQPTFKHLAKLLQLG